MRQNVGHTYTVCNFSSCGKECLKNRNVEGRFAIRADRNVLQIVIESIWEETKSSCRFKFERRNKPNEADNRELFLKKIDYSNSWRFEITLCQPQGRIGKKTCSLRQVRPNRAIILQHTWSYLCRTVIQKKHREVYASVWRTHLRNHFIILVATFPRLICIAKEV